MRISLVRTGGLAAMRRIVMVDTEALAAEKARQIESLIRQADLPSLSEPTMAVRRSPDRFRYTLTVEEEGRQSKVTLAEEEMPERLRPLLDALWREGEPGSKPPGTVTA